MKVNHFISTKSAIRSENPQLSAKSPQPMEGWRLSQGHVVPGNVNYAAVIAGSCNKANITLATHANQLTALELSINSSKTIPVEGIIVLY